jgi:hypothetical protein
MKVVYKSDDGKEFDTEQDCLAHEATYAKMSQLQEQVTNAIAEANDNEVGAWEMAQGIAEFYPQIKEIMECQ